MAVMNLVNPNGDFEAGAVGWSMRGPGGPIPAIVNNPTRAFSGSWCIRHAGAGELQDGAALSEGEFPVIPGQSITLSAQVSPYDGTAGTSGGVSLVWLDANKSIIRSTGGNEVRRREGNGYRLSIITSVAPPNAVFVLPQLLFNTSASNTVSVIYIDEVKWDYVNLYSLVLTSPTSGATYEHGSSVPLRVTLTGSAPTRIDYVATNTATAEVSTIGSSTEAPFAVNVDSLEAGTYQIKAIAVYSGSYNVTSATSTITIGTPPVADTREFKASNSYTYLIGENFINLGGSMPPTSRVLGVEVLVDYSLDVLVRSKDVDIASPAQANYDVAFAVVNNGVLEAVLVNNTGSTYAQVGAPMSTAIPINRSDFTMEEDGVSEGKRFTVLNGGKAAAVVGAEDQRFGLAPEFGSTFINYGVGIRFIPNLSSIPSYADAGDAVYRFKVHSFKVRVYFDAGSVEYYFASADKTEVIKGKLTHYYVYTGNFRTNDASGVLQLTSELEQMEGTQRWIGSDWTIHSSYPPTDNNQIGEVGEVQGELGMKYNGLPTQQQVLGNRSRYEFKTENFYGDPDLNSLYGVHGLPRAFAYNGDFFYKIYTQADPEKDSPRHVANHHGHLALGYYGGRVDISVAGEPYNFNGVDGASSWAFGDKVVGLLPLSGTILGVFGAKSVWGISGTTVDNFATQVISPNMGAVEYTITDMGFPVYANAYGIYTLNQIQQYGDYLGQPMSQDISPWLRPRLIRKLTSDKEVVCAYPVRSKNQYRLCFSDGYVTSMTLNGRQTPTFSFQKYFYTPEGDELPVDLFSYPCIVPAAISSELDEAGEERIHIANIEAPLPQPPAPDAPNLVFEVADLYYTETGGV